MEVIGRVIRDSRINSENYMLEMSIKEYYEMSRSILENNVYQRRRVKSSSSVYSLLKDDLKKGCLMPPIVLALTQKKDDDCIVDFINRNTSNLLILDGLQRSYTIKETVSELMSEDQHHQSLNNKIRVEIYIGINKLGILYRMLTLNTGQTPMSTRHQIEIIYSNYLNQEINGIKLIREIDDCAPQKIGEYRFRDIIEGFTSYIDRDYLILDRTDILDNIKSLERLATIDVDNELFEEFLRTYHKFVLRINSLCPGWSVSEDLKLQGRPFGNSVISIFNKSQSMTGFGCAIGRLLDFGAISSFEDINTNIDDINTQEISSGLNHIILCLDKIRIIAKKIGNDQRLYFYNFYKKLFDNNSDSFLDIKLSSELAYKAYEREIL